MEDPRDPIMIKVGEKITRTITALTGLDTSNGELLKAAKYILTNNGSTWPKNWPSKIMADIDSQNPDDRLLIAAALIIIQSDKNKEEYGEVTKSKW